MILNESGQKMFPNKVITVVDNWQPTVSVYFFYMISMSFPFLFFFPLAVLFYEKFWSPISFFNQERNRLSIAGQTKLALYSNVKFFLSYHIERELSCATIFKSNINAVIFDSS